VSKKTVKWNPNVSKTLCGATANVQQMARGQSVIPVVQILYENCLPSNPLLWKQKCMRTQLQNSSPA